MNDQTPLDQDRGGRDKGGKPAGKRAQQTLAACAEGGTQVEVSSNV